MKGAVVSATGVTGVRYRRQIELSTALADDEKRLALAALNDILDEVRTGRLSDFRMIPLRRVRRDGPRPMPLKRAHKPLVGFGPLGWIASAVLATLIVLALTGRDLLWDLLQLVGLVVGDENVIHYVARFHIWHQLSLVYEAGFNVVTMIPVLVALRIHPSRFGWWRYAIVVGWALFQPLYWVTRPLSRPLTDFFELAAPTLTFARAVTAADGVLELATALILLVVTRSWRVAAIIAAVIAVLTATQMLMQTPGTMSSGASLAVVVTWHVAVAAVVLTWAIRARIANVEEGCCPACGYDLTDLPSGRCPECGSATPPE